jgi:hypothetical protein
MKPERVQFTPEDISTFSGMLYWHSRSRVIDEIRRQDNRGVAFVTTQVRVCIAASAMMMFANMTIAPTKESFDAVVDDVLGTWTTWEKDSRNVLFEEIWSAGDATPLA